MGNVISLDFKYNFLESFNLTGEIAHSFTKAYSNGTLSYDKSSEGAYKILLEKIGGLIPFTLQYDRVDPYFDTTNSFISQDLENFQINGNNIQLTNQILLSPYFYNSRDNLKNTKVTTTKRNNPGLNLTWILPKNINFQGKIDSLQEKAEDDSINTKSISSMMSLMKTFYLFTTSLNYEKIYLRDKVNSSQDRNRDSIGLNINSSFNLKRSTFSWDLQESFSNEKNIELDKNNILNTHSFGMNIFLPNELNINYRLIITKNNSYQAVDDSTVKEGTFSVSKKVKKSLTMFLDYYQKNNYIYGSNNNYFEKKLTIKASLEI